MRRVAAVIGGGRRTRREDRGQKENQRRANDGHESLGAPMEVNRIGGIPPAEYYVSRPNTMRKVT
jgi:hypothetical protein